LTHEPTDPPTDPLADLPLRTPAETAQDRDDEEREVLSHEGRSQRDLFSDPAPEPEAAPLGPHAVPPAESAQPARSLRVARWKASLLDLAAHVVVLAILAIGVRVLGIRLDRSVLVPLTAAMVAFSFLYTVPSLMIWCRTPGMTAVGLIARGSGPFALTAGQALRRWLAGWLTWLTLGLAGWFNLGDRLSATRTRFFEQEDEPDAA